jgi:site-specific DNA recombinase
MSENLDTASAFGRAMIGIMSAFAQLEREAIKERMLMGKLARAKKGKFHGSVRVPIGYDYKDGDLITNEFEKMQVIRIFKEFNAGMPVNRIVRDLNAEGFTTKYGKWSLSTARQILEKRTYLGLLPYKGEFYQGNHEAFISQELFDNVQTILKRRKADLDEKGIRCGKATSALGGILICKCGRKMARCKVRNYLYYACRNGGCDQSVWKMSEMNDLVFSEIRKLSLECPKSAPKYVNEENIGQKVIEAKIGEIDRKIDRIIDLYALDDTPKDVIQQKLSDLNVQKESLLRQLDDIETPMTQEEVIDLAKSLDRVLKSDDIDEIRALVTALIDHINVDGDNITIHWNFT